jgi:hypothetical protein
MSSSRIGFGDSPPPYTRYPRPEDNNTNDLPPSYRQVVLETRASAHYERREARRNERREVATPEEHEGDVIDKVIDVSIKFFRFIYITVPKIAYNDLKSTFS